MVLKWRIQKKGMVKKSLMLLVAKINSLYVAENELNLVASVVRYSVFGMVLVTQP
jgi:hypothetical protein